jgi:hypothetical protein
MLQQLVERLSGHRNGASASAFVEDGERVVDEDSRAEIALPELDG